MRACLPVPLLALLCLVGSGCTLVGGTSMSQPTAPCPLEHGRWEPFEPMWDEFDGGGLDATKWHPNNPQWKGRQPGWFSPANVAVRDGQLHLTMKHENLEGLPRGYHTYTSAAVKSKTKVRYGYFEIKAKAMNSKGSSAFWFYDGTPEIWTEIDVFEMGAGHPKHEHAVHMNVHVFHTLVNPDRHWAKPTRWEAPWRLADEFHVYGLEWDPEAIRFYVDGKVVRELKNTHWHQPLTLNFDSETMPQWFGLPEVETLPSTFSIEYMRAWKRLDLPGETPVRACTFEFPGADAKGQTARYRLKTDGEGTLIVVARFDAAGRKSRVHLEYEHPTFFAAQQAPAIEKRIAVKDTAGKRAFFTIRWEKVKGEKQNHGYRADTVAIEPAVRPEAPRSETYEFEAEGGAIVRMTLAY